MKRFIWLILFFPFTTFADCTPPPVSQPNGPISQTEFNSPIVINCYSPEDLTKVKLSVSSFDNKTYRDSLIQQCQQQVANYEAAATAYQACFEQSVKQPYTPLPPPAPTPTPALVNSNGPTIPDHWTPPVTNIPVSTPTPAVTPTPEPVSNPIIAPSPAPVFKAPIKKSAPKPVSVTVPISTDTQVTELTTKSYVPPVVTPAHNNIFSRFWSFIKSLF